MSLLIRASTSSLKPFFSISSVSFCQGFLLTNQGYWAICRARLMSCSFSLTCTLGTTLTGMRGILQDEVMRLRPPAKTGHGTAERIVAPGDMLIFVSGHHPIYGTQILYFTDPVLAKRAEIRPPSQFLAIEEGRIIQQPSRRPHTQRHQRCGTSAPVECNRSGHGRGDVSNGNGFLERAGAGRAAEGHCSCRSRNRIY